MQPGEQQLGGEGSERVAKRRRTDNHDLASAVFILAVHPTGPAGRSGKLEGMQELISVDGWSVYGQDLATITQHVVGEPGSLVVLEVPTLSLSRLRVFLGMHARAEGAADRLLPLAFKRLDLTAVYA